jgi:hypothetical protein
MTANAARQGRENRRRVKMRWVAAAGVIFAAAFFAGGVFGIPVWKPNPIYVNAQNYSVQGQTTANLPNVPNATVNSQSWGTRGPCSPTGSFALGPTTPTGANIAELGVASFATCGPGDFAIALGFTPASTLTKGTDTITIGTTWNSSAKSATLTETVSVTSGTLTAGAYLYLIVDYGSVAPTEVDTLTISITGT